MEDLGPHGGACGQGGSGRFALVHRLVVCPQRLCKVLFQLFSQEFILRRATVGNIFKELVLPEGDRGRAHSCSSPAVPRPTEKVFTLGQRFSAMPSLPGENVIFI